MSKIIITGGAGFIGSELAKTLSDKGKKVLIIDNLSYGHKENIPEELQSQFVQMDVRDKAIHEHIEEGDIIFHFAGIAPLPSCQIDSQEAFDVNVGGLANVLDGMRKKGAAQIIFASTSAVYENATSYPCKEDDAINLPTLTYPLTKYAAELLLKSVNACFGTPYTILRFFNVYGPHQDFKRKHPPLMGYILKCILEGETPTFYSNGDHKRDYVFSHDLINCCEHVMNNPRAMNEVFNVTSEKNYSVAEIYQLFRKVTGKALPEPAYGDPMKFWDKHEELFQGVYQMNKEIIEKEVKKYASGSAEKARSQLGWEAQTSLEDGIRACYQFCLDNNT